MAGFIFIFKKKMEEALNEFIEHWKSKKHVIGILLTGSYAVGLQNENSDIDIRIIFNNTKKKTIKGLSIINGFKFSYLGRNHEITRKIFNTQFLNQEKRESYIFNIGKILYDKSGEVQRLIDLAYTYVNTPTLLKPKTQDIIRTSLYALYSHKNHLISLSENTPFFYYHYYIFLKQALTSYSNLLNCEPFLDMKTEKLLCDAEYRRAYHWPNFPDQTFSKMWISIISLEKVNKASVLKLYEYIENKIGKVDEKKFIISWNEV
ncbi:nucleotidyltransferase domain-containing protein [Elizabethkingia anophelis]|nr:nucleotidyltransferase domain-containing protein [Elizabethkingia anophelis]MCT4081545.1 nucleotidyltransferase domain-containing protein [Elizabethkingia anophelis]MCT4092094.1 nucleotidyltransferase domain-containing protein [Elizabethkingia anophelis]